MSENLLHLEMSYSTLFPTLDVYTYLNTANAGLLSTSLREWRNKHDTDYLMSGSKLRISNSNIFTVLRQNLSALFGSKAENTYLVPNFSIGYNTLLDGLERTHRVLLLTDDYPSVSYPVLSRKFNYSEVQISHNPEDRILKAIEVYKPDVFAFSIVQYVSGIRLAPQFLKEISRNYPDLLLIADGTQYCGTAAFDFDTSGLDAVISSGYKWMLGGYGNGFVLLSDRLKDLLYHDKKDSALPNAPFLNGKDHLSMRFEPGHLDTLNFGSLNQSVMYLQSLGLKNIEKMCQTLCEQARAAFYARGLISETFANRKAQSTIMSLPLNQRSFEKLYANNILCTDRGAGARVSFHFYNTTEDLDHLLRILDKND